MAKEDSVECKTWWNLVKREKFEKNGETEEKNLILHQKLLFTLKNESMEKSFIMTNR